MRALGAGEGAFAAAKGLDEVQDLLMAAGAYLFAAAAALAHAVGEAVQRRETVGTLLQSFHFGPEYG